MYTQGINQSANFRFLQRRSSYLASTETVRDLLVPTGITVIEKWLPAETVSVTLLPTESISRKQNNAVSAGSHSSCTTLSAGSKRSLPVSTEDKYDGLSLQEVAYTNIILFLRLTPLRWAITVNKIKEDISTS